MVRETGLDSRCGLGRGPSARKKLQWSFFSEAGRSPWKALKPHRGFIHYCALQVLFHYI